MNDNFNGYYTANCSNCGEIDVCRVLTENWNCYDCLGAFEGAFLVCEDCIAVMKACHRHEVKS